jgi:hypothetical protein
VQVQTLAWLLIPQRREVRRADELLVRQTVDGPVELNRFVGIEGIHPTAAPSRHGVAEKWRDAIAQIERRELQPIDEAESQQRPLKKRDRHVVLRQPATDRIRREPVVERAFENELDEALQVELVSWHAQNDPRLRLWRVPNRAGVAHRAIQANLIDPETPPS